MAQLLELPPLRFSRIITGAISVFLSIDSPFWRTLLELIRGPGRVARAWIDGKRRTYVNPVKFLIVICIAVALLYEPLQSLRAEQIKLGEALHETGLGHYTTQYFAFLCLVVVLPVAVLMQWIGSALRMPRPGSSGMYSGTTATGWQP
ncbi:MAG: hypothetical protein ACI841_000632 [Planctomycetota bacterium]|jgi:hypothetical protein